MEILLAHFEKYPLMQPRDAVKLLYQRVFGGEHLAPSPERFLRFLREEYASVPHAEDAEAVEEIGGGIVRVYLAPLGEEALEPLASAFLHYAVPRGSREAFEGELSRLKALSEQGKTPFPRSALEEYLSGYDRSPVRHSETYREAYRPAYRILPAEALPLIPGISY